MSTEKTPLANKLILLVLVLILICLVLVLIQGQFNRASLPSEPVQTVETEAPQVPLSEAAVTPRTPPARPRSDATAKTNVVRRVSVTPQSVAAPPAARWIRDDVGLDASAPVLTAEVGPLAAVGTTTGNRNRSAAQIQGRVWISGTLPPETSLAITDPVCGRLQGGSVTSRHYVVTSDGRLADVFVYIKRGLEGYQFPVSTNVPVLNNTQCLFEPYVMGVQVGQNFSIKNSDPTLHNAHAVARLNREFNVALAAKAPPIARSFTKPEVLVRIKCDVHPWMFAYLGVVAHPFFAVTDKDGVFALPPNLPPGTYTVAAYHPKAGEQTSNITIGDGEVKTIEFQYQVNTLSKAE